MNHEYLIHGVGASFELVLILPYILVSLLYILAAIGSSRYQKKWPVYRCVYWVLGVICAAAAVIGPLADRAHTSFSVHMVGHLLLGMLAPLLMVLAAPITLALRSLPVNTARGLAGLLKIRPVRILHEPLVTSVLNVGGLWILYTSNLYSAMQHNPYLHLFIHIHVFLAGYLFTASIIYIDPVPYRTSFTYRAFVLLIALAAHGILAKVIYSHPPNGVTVLQAETGAILMYYGGDAIDLILIFIFCFQWYKATRPRIHKNFLKEHPIIAKDERGVLSGKETAKSTTRGYTDPKYSSK